MNSLFEQSKLEEQIEQSSNYFKPKDGKSCILQIDPTQEFAPIVNERFKTPDRFSGEQFLGVGFK
jgi:hypothetical protein